eukprot:2296763-Prymnesium_polylepis.1
MTTRRPRCSPTPSRWKDTSQTPKRKPGPSTCDAPAAGPSECDVEMCAQERFETGQARQAVCVILAADCARVRLMPDDISVNVIRVQRVYV